MRTFGDLSALNRGPARVLALRLSKRATDESRGGVKLDVVQAERNRQLCVKTRQPEGRRANQ